MKKRCVPNTISKRFRRKLLRAKDPFQLWLRCKRPIVWSRLCRWWHNQFLNVITNIDPMDTPFISMAARVPAKSVIQIWGIDYDDDVVRRN